MGHHLDVSDPFAPEIERLFQEEKRVSHTFVIQCGTGEVKGTGSLSCEPGEAGAEQLGVVDEPLTVLFYLGGPSSAEFLAAVSGALADEGEAVVGFSEHGFIDLGHGASGV